MDKITPKQQRFVSEYLIDLNATQAAIRAGYSPRTAKQMGTENLAKPVLAAAIQKAMADRGKRTEIEADDVIRELAKIGFANMMDYTRVTDEGEMVVDLSKITREQAAAIGEVTVEDFMDGRGDDARAVRRVRFKLADKRAALVDLGRHFALFTDNMRFAGKDGGPIQHEVRERADAFIAGLVVLAGRSDAGKATRH